MVAIIAGTFEGSYLVDTLGIGITVGQLGEALIDVCNI